MTQGVKIAVTPKLGATIREYRRREGLTIAEFLQHIEERSGPGAPRLDDAFMSRLESGKVTSVQAEKIRAVALGMGLKDLEELQELASSDRDIPFRIASVHALFAAPVIAAANRLAIRGATLVSFGRQQNTEFIPTASELNSDGHRRIFHTAPHYRASQSPDQEHLDDSIQRVPWENGVSRYCTGLEIDYLWQRGEIDIAVVSRESFSHLSSRASREGIIVGTVSQSARAVNFLALVYPGKISQSADQTEERLNLLSRGHVQADADPSPRDPRPFLRACARLLRHELRVMFPKGTIAHQQIDRLMAVYECLDRDTLIRREPHNLSEYDTFRNMAFERAKKTGIALLALWEPFATYLRKGWDDLVKNDDPDAFEALAKTGGSTGNGAASFMPESGYRCSVDFPLARLFGYVGMPNPLFPMDIIATRAFLNKGAPARTLLIELFDVLEREIRALHEAVECYSDNIVRFQSTMVRAADDPRNRSESQRPDPDEEWLARVSANWLTSRANETVRYLSSAFGLQIPEMFRALCELEFSLTFDRSFANYLLSNAQPR